MPVVILVLAVAWRFYLRCFEDAPEVETKEKTFLRSQAVAPILFNLPTGFKFSKYATGHDDDDVKSDIMESSSGSLISLPITCGCKLFKKRSARTKAAKRDTVVFETSGSREGSIFALTEAHEEESLVRGRVAHFFPANWTTAKQSLITGSGASLFAKGERSSDFGSRGSRRSSSLPKGGVTFSKEVLSRSSSADPFHPSMFKNRASFSAETLHDEDGENEKKPKITFIDDRTDRRTSRRKSSTVKFGGLSDI